jgi:hypothetical protein
MERDVFFFMPPPTARILCCVCGPEPGLQRAFLRLLDEAVKNQHFALLHAEQHARDPVARKLASHLPQGIAQRPTQRHSNGPPILDPHQILPDGVAVFLIQCA